MDARIDCALCCGRGRVPLPVICQPHEKGTCCLRCGAGLDDWRAYALVGTVAFVAPRDPMTDEQRVYLRDVLVVSTTSPGVGYMSETEFSLTKRTGRPVPGTRLLEVAAAAAEGERPQTVTALSLAPRTPLEALAMFFDQLSRTINELLEGLSEVLRSALFPLVIHPRGKLSGSPVPINSILCLQAQAEDAWLARNPAGTAVVEEVTRPGRPLRWLLWLRLGPFEGAYELGPETTDRQLAAVVETAWALAADQLARGWRP